jgi:hypothetical protein
MTMVRSYRNIMFLGLMMLVASSACAVEGLFSEARGAVVRQTLDQAEKATRYQTDTQVREQVRSSRESLEATSAALSLHRQTDVFGYGILSIPRE